MTNPLTAIPELLGKLITEHGSADIQGKHIALLKEQFAVLERENAKLTSEKWELKTENKILKSQIKSLKQKNANLTKKIESQNKPPVKKWATCPKCLESDYRFTGEFAEPANDFFRNAGMRLRIYKCESCGYTGTGK
jgi:predicted Zn-ribbon and HTH transcriptional regulator